MKLGRATLEKEKEDMSSKEKKASGEVAESKNEASKNAAEDGIELNGVDVPLKGEEFDVQAGGESDSDAETETVLKFQQLEQQLQEQQEKLEEQGALVAEYEDLLKRKQADFENFRKRAQKETQDFKKYANAEIVLDVLSMMDDFERAIESTESSKDFDALHEGILLVEKQLRNTLESKYSVKAIDSVGKPFDPNVHDAIMMEESDKHEEDTVLEDFQKGYVMHDRVIRPSKVKVAKAMSSAGSEKDEQAE
jgi:molecular chaperone GrpE